MATSADAEKLNVEGKGAETKEDLGENEVEEPRESKRKTWNRILREVDAIKGWYYFGTFGGILAGGMMALFALFFGFMVDIFNSIEVERDAWQILSFFLAMGTGFGIFTFIQFFAFVQVAGLTGAHMRIAYYNALMKMEKSYYDDEGTGGIAAKMYSQAKLIEVGLGSQFGMVFQSIGMIIGGFTVALYESWLFSLILLGLTPVVIIGGGIGGKILSELSKEGRDTYKEASSRSKEILSGIMTVKSLSAEANEASLYERLIAVGYPLMKKKAHRVGGAMGSMQFINFGFFYGMGMYLGAIQVADFYESNQSKGFSPGEVFSAFFGVFIGGFGVGNFFTALPDVKEGLTAVQELYRTIDRVPKIRAPEDGAEPISIKVSGEIVLENLTFAYPSRPDVDVLQNISLKIMPGNTVAFVGPSGCGKSTIISLLERFYDPEHGSVMIDGIPIWNLDIENLRNQIGYVGQEPVLFDGSITENILLGTEYGLEDAKRAAVQANAHAFIEQFPEKYDTKVGEGGAQLSGGQKQRISIARALVRQPQILLLDEATSALDTESERIVQEALDKIISCGKRTCIVIAHRLSTITNADMIVVFQQGRIVQQGTYNDLAVDKKGVFYAMLKAQDVLGVDALKKKKMARGISEPLSLRQASIRSQ